MKPYLMLQCTSCNCISHLCRNQGVRSVHVAGSVNMEQSTMNDSYSYMITKKEVSKILTLSVLQPSNNTTTISYYN